MTKKNQVQAAKKSWARANRLAELAGIPPNTARNLLTQFDKDSPTLKLLDEGKDARNKQIRNLIERAQIHAENNYTASASQRASKGDPNQSPRAGAPSPKAKTNTPTTELATLQTLAKLAKQAEGGIPEIKRCLQALENLQIT